MLFETPAEMRLRAFVSKVGTLFRFPQNVHTASFVGFLIKPTDISGKIRQDLSSFIKWKQYASG